MNLTNVIINYRRYFKRSDNLILTIADRKQILKFEPEEVVPAVALDEVVFVRVVIAGTFVGKIRIAVYVSIIILEVSDRNDRVPKKA
jgi:hypothetical protein